MYEILKNGGLGKGGLNFDAKVRRGSFKADDLFHAHIAGMDSFAVGLKLAQKLLDDGVIEDLISARYDLPTRASAKRLWKALPIFKKLEAHALDSVKSTSNPQPREDQRKINQYMLTMYK